MKNTLVIDLDRCSGCDSCVAACKMENQMNLGVVDVYKRQRYAPTARTPRRLRPFSSGA